jgi:hypothetical protein
MSHTFFRYIRPTNATSPVAFVCNHGQGERMNAKRTGFIFTLLAAVWLLVVACGLGSSGAKPTPTPVIGLTSLWPDVPVFPDSTPDPATNFFNQFNQASPAMMTFIFYTDKQPADVAAFYTDDMMKAQGWTPQPYAVVNWFSVGHGEGPQIHDNYTPGGCGLGTYNNEQVAYCTFSKTDEQGQLVQLIITIKPDQNNSGQTMLNYVRMTASDDKSTPSSVQPTP